jgi:hypothetical protein
MELVDIVDFEAFVTTLHLFLVFLLLYLLPDIPPSHMSYTTYNFVYPFNWCVEDLFLSTPVEAHIKQVTSNKSGRV